MKSFFKSVLANIVAILMIGGVFFLFFIMMIAASAISGDPKTTVKNNSILTLDYKTNIIESPAEDQQDFLSFTNKSKNVLAYDVIEAIKKAKTDDKIKGISLESDFVNAGMTHLDDVRTALEDFKKSGKFVYAYGNTSTQSAYYLNSVADKYYLNPSGLIELRGMSSEVLYLKSLAEKYGVGIEIIRHGKFKAAVEPFMRDDMSPENKEQISTLLKDIWSNNTAKMAASRKIDSAQFRTVVDSLYGIIPELALKNRLADKLIQKGEYDELMRAKLKVDKTEKLNKISFKSYINSYKESSSSKEHVAVLYASGSINNGEGHDGIYARNFVKHIRDLADDKKVKAVVFRVNSPGGSANASDEILFELQQLKKKKPVVVSFGDYAASGGYYIAMGADKIYSEPNTITGSIGVFGIFPYAKELANRNGVYAHSVSTNANSDMVSAINGLSPGGLSILTRSVEGTYKRFVHFVTQNRKKSFEEIDAVGGGRVWSGTRAKSIGLVDELGTLNDAIAYAAKQAKMKDASVKSYPKKRSEFEELFEDLEEDEITAKILTKKLGKENAKIFEMMTNPKMKPSVQMEMPFKLKIQ